MPYQLIEDFRGGLELRRSPLAAPAGTLTVCENCHITEAGEIESRKSFVRTATLPLGTIGLANVGDQLYTFGSAAEPSGIPDYIRFQQLNHPNNPAAYVTDIISHDSFNGRLYVAARFSDRSVIHFYDGVYVPEITRIQEATTANSSVIQRFADQINAFSSFTATTPDGDLQVVSADGEPMTIGYNIITSASVGAYWQYVSGIGTFPNALTTFKLRLPGPFDPAARYDIYIGHPNAGDRFFSVSGLLTLYATSVRTHKSKMLTTMGGQVYFSAVKNPMRHFIAGSDTNAGAGFITPGIQDSNYSDVVGFGNYNGRLAIFLRNGVQIWNMPVDEDQIAILQTLASVGTNAPKSIVDLGGNDTFFLDPSGIRSLRARGLTDAAFTQDVGSPIDPYVRRRQQELGWAMATNAIGAVEPLDGRLWMVLGDEIYVLSYFKENRVSAWSIYKPGFVPSYMVAANDRLWLRDQAHGIYCYGGTSGFQYPAPGEVTCRVRMPYMDFGTPANRKTGLGFGINMSGKWDVVAYIDPSNEPYLYPIQVGTFDKLSYGLGRVNVPGMPTHVALEFVSSYGGRNTISQVAVHYDKLDPQ